MARNNLVIDLEAFSDEVIDKAEYGVETTTEILYNESRRRIAVDTGGTRDSIEMDNQGLEGVVFVGSIIGIYLEHGTGIYADAKGGGSRAKKIPWTYYKDGQFFTTYGMVAQPFWYPSLDIAEQYFNNYFRR